MRTQAGMRTQREVYVMQETVPGAGAILLDAPVVAWSIANLKRAADAKAGTSLNWDSDGGYPLIALTTGARFTIYSVRIIDG